MIPSDIHHVYNGAFYGCLVLIGAVSHLPVQKNPLRMILLGATIGLVSSMIAIAVVVLVGPNSFTSVFKSSGGPYPWFIDYMLYCAAVLLGPLWGAAAVAATYFCRGKLLTKK